MIGGKISDGSMLGLGPKNVKTLLPVPGAQQPTFCKIICLFLRDQNLFVHLVGFVDGAVRWKRPILPGCGHHGGESCASSIVDR